MGVASPPVQKLLPLPASWPPTLVVVIDTEEEFDWTASFDSANTAVTNIGLQPLAQDIFDSHEVVPTYVIDYPVANTLSAVAVLGSFAAEGRCARGAHLLRWVMAPAVGPGVSRHS